MKNSIVHINNNNMNGMKNRNSITARKYRVRITQTAPVEKENDIAPPQRMSLSPISSTATSICGNSSVSFHSFQPIVVNTADQKGRNNTTNSSSAFLPENDVDAITSCANATTGTSTTTNTSSSSGTECLDASSLRSLSPVSSTTFPTTTLCGDFDKSSTLPVNDTLTKSEVHHEATRINTIESILQQYPKELMSLTKNSPKIAELQQQLDGNTTTESNVATTTAAAEIVGIIVSDMMQLHQVLVQVESNIKKVKSRMEELQNRPNDTTTNDHANDPTESHNASTDMKLTSINNDGNNDASRHPFDTVETENVATTHVSSENSAVLEARIAHLEHELSTSQTTIHQLKTQKQHVVANTKKKKILLDDTERRLLQTENELQTVLSERNRLRVSLQEMTEVRDSYKQKLRNQQEIVKDSKQCMMEYKNKLQKTEHMRSLENELLDNFRKLAVHTGLYVNIRSMWQDFFGVAFVLLNFLCLLFPLLFGKATNGVNQSAY